MTLRDIKKISIYLLLTFSILGCSLKFTDSHLQNINDTNEYNYIIKIDINSSKEKVWNLITDFKNYHKWNSVLRMEHNENLEIGKEFDVTIFETDGSIADSFKAISINKTKYQSFSASQTILTKSFFKATHYFVIEEISKEQVIFIQKWKLEGIVGYLFDNMIIDVLKLFKKMNIELKEEVEKT